MRATSYSRSRKPSGEFVLSCLVLATSIGAVAPAVAQATPGGQTCRSSAWTGTVSYSRTQSLSDSKTTERVSARGRDTRNFEMNSRYRALVAVREAPEQDGSNVGIATVSHSMTSNDTATSTETNSCDQGKSWQAMSGKFTTQQMTRGEGREETTVNVGVNDDGSYTIRVVAPSIKGLASGSQSSSYSGQCTKKEGKTVNYPQTETSIPGGSLASNGRNRIDPANPNRLSGSYSETNLGITESITWSLEKCGAPLRITDITFEHMNFPTWDQWEEIVEQRGTIDGNWVRIKATVFNASAESKSGEVRFKETYRGDKWDGARQDAQLGDRAVSVSLEPGEAKEVELLWDSSGYAWFDDGRPRLVQRVKAELWENNRLADTRTENLKIAPKPLVLVHGPWTTWQSFQAWQNILTLSHSYDWKAFPVGEKAEQGSMNTGGNMFSTQQTATTGENANALESYIRYAQEDRNAWHVDVVAHSSGGRVARWYIDRLMPAAYSDGRPQISHLVMLGTPHLGTPCADVMNFALEMVGKSIHVVREITQDSMGAFNKVHTNRKGVRFSALAGNPLPSMCKSIVPNDGFVPVPSAHWIIADHRESTSIHTDLTSAKDFSDFVKPRVAIGPSGNHMPEPLTLRSDRTHDSRPYFMNASYRMELASNDSPGSLKPDFAKAVTVAARQSMEIDIPMQQALNFGVTFMGAREISATLYDGKGTVVGRNLTRTPEAAALFRSIYVDKAVNAGTWKLKLENSAGKPLEVVLATWRNADAGRGRREVMASR